VFVPSCVTDTVAVCAPSNADGPNVMVNVVEPIAATGLVGCDATEKSPADTVTTPRVRSPDPALLIVNVFVLVPTLMTNEPKSVSSVGLGVTSPLGIETLLPVMSICGTPIPVPCMANVNGFSSESLLAMLTVALRNPIADGLNCTVIGDKPDGIRGLVGCAVTVKSAAWVPVMTTSGESVNTRFAVPPLDTV